MDCFVTWFCSWFGVPGRVVKVDVGWSSEIRNGGGEGSRSQDTSCHSTGNSLSLGCGGRKSHYDPTTQIVSCKILNSPKIPGTMPLPNHKMSFLSFLFRSSANFQSSFSVSLSTRPNQKQMMKETKMEDGSSKKAPNSQQKAISKQKNHRREKDAEKKQFEKKN